MQLFDGMASNAAAGLLAPGVRVVTWSLSGDIRGDGDCVCVDACHASERWCSVADVLAISRRHWLLRHRTETELLVTDASPAKDQFLWMAALYGWLTCGQPLADWPREIKTVRVLPGGYA